MSIPKTEMRNPKSTNFSKMTSEEMALLVIRANHDAVTAVENASQQIAVAIDAVTKAFENGNRLIYAGAGTSGRLAIVDASECPPTFGVPYEQVSGILAGGRDRMFDAGEKEEDSYENGCQDIMDKGVRAGDVVMGISAAGNAAYVVGAMETAKKFGCITIGLTCNPDTAVLRAADIPIFTDTGAEILTGSTRLKAGTAQKIVLNTLTTCSMAKTGKVYENMMINLAPSNEKLKQRVVRITREILSCDEDTAVAALDANDWNIKNAIEYAKERISK